MKSQVHMGFMQFQGSPYIGAPSANYGKDYLSPYPNSQDANAYSFSNVPEVGSDYSNTLDEIGGEDIIFGEEIELYVLI